MTKPARTIRVFIASPGDLAEERRAFKDVIDELNDGFAAALDVKFVPLGWEDMLSEVGRRPQDVINNDVDRCDVFILAMYRRWGANAPDIPKPATSRTEEEYLRALERMQKTQSPRMFVFFKKVDAESMSDPGPHLTAVLAFQRKLEESLIVQYRTFEDVAGFRTEIKNHLRDVAKPDEPPPVVAPLTPVKMPPDRIKELEEALAAAEKRTKLAEAALKQAETSRQMSKKQVSTPRTTIEELALARADELALALAERAAKAALEGRVEEARQDFAMAVEGTNSLKVLFIAFDFFYRVGDLQMAESLVRRRLAILGPDSQSAETARALGNLGVIYQAHGDLDAAAAVHEKALTIDSTNGNDEGIARHCSNLGLIYLTRGDWDRAEQFAQRALAIFMKRTHEENMAVEYGNLGLIYREQEKLAEAEAMHNLALALDEKHNRRESMASQYGNLGTIYRMQEDFARAREFTQKSLAIFEKFSNQQGMANQYGNLGLIFHDEKQPDLAAELFQRALTINEKLGSQQGMANDYANLSLVAKDRDDLKLARELGAKARDLYAKIGMPHRVRQVQEWFDDLPPVMSQE